MSKVYFKIIIPNYNNADWLDKCLTSVFTQTFTNFKVIFIDDASTDSSVSIVKSNFLPLYKDRLELIESTVKVWNGGSRNLGIQHIVDSEYTLFLDSDDWFAELNTLEKLYTIIENNNRPDCVRLSYNCIINNNAFPIILENQNTPELLVNALEVACWTKCIKTNLIQLFPENTLMEDVVQHIKQCDYLQTVYLYQTPVVCWNRDNTNSCSKVENQNLQQGKWQSSMYRYAADLMDLQVVHSYCEEHRKWRLSVVLDNIKQDKYIQ